MEWQQRYIDLRTGKTSTFAGGRDLADHSKLEIELQDAQKDYRAKGYLVAKIEPVPTFSDEDHTVSYQMKVTEGDLFHMGDLRMTGLDQGALDKLEKELEAESWRCL